VHGVLVFNALLVLGLEFGELLFQPTNLRGLHMFLHRGTVLRFVAGAQAMAVEANRRRWWKRLRSVSGEKEEEPITRMMKAAQAVILFR